MNESEQRIILVVDDSPSECAILRNVLSNEGFEIITAENGVQALDIVTKIRKRIGLIVLDIVMPEMDGITVLHHIHQDA